MKQETSDALVRGGAGIAGTATTWSLQDSNAVVALCVGVVTFIYIVVQLFYLLRKWHRLEQTNWKTHDTDRVPLDGGKK